MTITVKHKFVSAIPDSTDTTVVRPSNWNDTHELTGLGTMAEQNASSVAITGGSINGVAIGGTTAGDGTFDVLTANVSRINTATATSLSIGTLTYTPANALISSQSSVSTYNQIILQNSNAGATASADYIVNNDLSTDTTYYGDFGMNSSNWAGTGAFNTANTVYLTATNSDLALGTTTSNAIHFVVNGGTTDAATINSSGTFSTTKDSTISGLTVGLGGGSVSSNTVVGNGAMTATATGVRNSAFGYSALRDTTSGSNNNAFGRFVLASNTTGYENAGFGGGVSSCLVNNLSGSQNSAFGNGALGSNVSGNANSALGYQSLVNNTASNNTAVGYQAGYSNTTGSNNVAIGYQTAYGATTGLYNVAIGQQALYSVGNVSGLTAIGYQSQYSNNGGSNNVSLGYLSLYSTVTGGSNTAIGNFALYANTATGNTAVGYQASYSNTSGNSNSAFGTSALQNTTTGNNNSAFGYQSLISNTTGGGNSAFGLYAMQLNTTGISNVSVGQQALASNLTSNNNTALGFQSLYSNTAANNVAIGYQAGYGITSGANNVIIGSYQGTAAPISATGSNYIVLSDGAGNVRQTIDSSGNVGIGTTSPSTLLTLEKANTAYRGQLSINGGATGIAQITLYSGSTTNTNLTGQLYSSADNISVHLSAYQSTGFLVFETNGNTERFRVGKDGQWGIGGATYGTSGQAFISGGSSAAPTWGDVVTPTGTQTLTNKWVQQRVLASTANSATPTLNTDNYDMMVITGQSVAITSFTTNLTGTPVNGQKLWIAITGTGAIAITWGAKFESSTVTLPSTTVTTARLDVGFVWNVASSAWRCVAVA